jgi:predicted RNase H-like HicB family nuclease
MSDGETRSEAVANVEDAIATWIYCAHKARANPRAERGQLP